VPKLRLRRCETQALDLCQRAGRRGRRFDGFVWCFFVRRIRIHLRRLNDAGRRPITQLASTIMRKYLD